MASNVTVRKDYRKINTYGYQRNVATENDQLIKRFLKKVDKADLMRDLHKHDYYVSPSMKKRLKRKEAAKRRRKEELKLAKILAKKAEQFGGIDK